MIANLYMAYAIFFFLEHGPRRAGQELKFNNNMDLEDHVRSVSMESFITRYQDCHISFCVSNYASEFHQVNKFANVSLY